MKKSIIYSLLSVLFLGIFCINVSAQSNFSQALKTCESYSKQGSIEHNGEVFNLLITLEKSKNGQCTYKEKIYQDKDYQMLTCNFSQTQLDFMSKSMLRFQDTFKTQIAQNSIFEAKMTNNGEIFQKYLIHPEYCKITHSKK